MSDFKDTINLLRPFYRGLPVIVGIMVISVMAVKKYLDYATPMYESVAEIKLADAKSGISNSNLYRDFDLFASNNKIGVEVEMVKSQVVVERLLKNIDLSITSYRVGDFRKTELYNDCPFIIVPKDVSSQGYDTVFAFSIVQDSLVQITTESKQIIKGKLNSLAITPRASFYILKNDALAKARPSLHINDRYEFTINSQKKLADELRSKLDVVYLDKEVPILRIAYKTPSPEKSADIVNTVSEAYIKDYLAEKLAAADTTVDFLSKQVKEYGGKLTASEASVENFRKTNRVINLKQEGETGLRGLSELRNRRAGLQMDLMAVDSLDNYVRKGKDHFDALATNFQSFNDLLSTELLKKIKALQTDRHDLLLKYTPENDKVKIVDKKMDDLYAYLGEAVKNTRENLQIKYDDLGKTIAKEEAYFESFPTKDRNMNMLERNTNMNEQVFRFLHEKKTDAEIARAANISFHRIISRAEISKDPVSPKPGLLKAVAGFLGFFGGVALIFLVHTIKARIGNETNIQKNSDTVIFARIPFLKNAQLADNTFQKIAIDLQVKGWLEKNSVIAISSFDDHEGKRTATIGIAKAAAILGKKILVVDVDGKTTVTQSADANIIKLTAIKENWKQPAILKGLLQQWKENHDVVVIKNPCISIDPSALLLMNEATINLMMVDTRLTKLKKIEETDLLKIEMGLSNIQFVLNKEGYTPNIFIEAYKIIKTLSFKKPFIKFTV